jgi:hypothetical protein
LKFALTIAKDIGCIGAGTGRQHIAKNGFERLVKAD